LSLVLDVVALLFVVVGDEDFGHEDSLVDASAFILLVDFLLAALRHLLLGPSVHFPLLVEVVSLSLPQKSFLLHANQNAKVRQDAFPLTPGFAYYQFNYYLFLPNTFNLKPLKSLIINSEENDYWSRFRGVLG